MSLPRCRLAHRRRYARRERCPSSPRARRCAVSGYINAGAVISPCERYRYRLWREWRGSASDENWRSLTDDDGQRAVDGGGHALGEPKSCVFVMLNPSTADGKQDDPTIRRCVAFAKRLKFDRLEVINLFAHRATNPKELLALNHDDDPVGPNNLRQVAAVLDGAGLIVCAWGAHGCHLGQDETMLGWLADCDAPVVALDLTKDGHPRHPLYLRSDAEPRPFNGARP